MKKFLAALAATLLLVATPTAADASTDELHPDVVYALEALPGGVAIGTHQAVWPELGMELTASSRFARSVGSCATGSYCAYSGSGLTGTRLAFTICTTVSTAPLRTVKSIANARSSGMVQARNSAGQVLATAFANSSASVSGTTVGLRCAL